MSRQLAARLVGWPIGLMLLAVLGPTGTIRGQDEGPSQERSPAARERPKTSEDEQPRSDQNERRGRARRERRAESTELRRALRAAQHEAQVLEARLAIKRAEVQKLQAELKLQALEASDGERVGDQNLKFELRPNARLMMTLKDVERAAVDFPDTITIEYPPTEHLRQLLEKRMQRFEQSSPKQRDPKTAAIIDTLDKPLTMPFPDKTPLEDVIKYVRKATQSPALPDGIPIYVDPMSMQEAEVTMESKVSLNLDGVPLKKSLALILKQVGLSFQVKDGLLTIISPEGE